jgi:2,7-dihydroxy-5-methyl-1-naphthoate 7-O-methyltransferase
LIRTCSASSTSTASAGRFAGIYSTLLDFVRTGQSQYASAFGLPFFEDLAAHPNLGETFDAMMAEGHGDEGRVPKLTTGWENVQWVVDVGGGKGHVIAHVLRANPKARATLVELPATAERATDAFEEAGFSDRAQAVGQSFFDPLPAGADLYLLKKVLNDWPDRETTAILSRCAEAARPTGRVVVLGGVSAGDRTRPLEPDMIVAGGKNNTMAEFRELASQAGLEVSAAGQQPSGYFVVECRPT